MTNPGRPQTTVAARWPRRRVIAAAGVLGWALLLAVLAYVSARDDPPTVREQRDLADATPVVDRALGAVAGAASAPQTSGGPAIVAIGNRRIETGCRISAVRPGASLTRVLTIYTTPEDGPALLERIGDGLPSAYQLWIGRDAGGAARTLSIDAGEFVGLRGEFAQPGVIRVTAETGCRPQPARPDPPDEPEVLVADRAGRVLAVLGVPASRESAATVSCPAGGSVGTAVAAGYPAGALDGLAESLRPLTAGTTVLLDEPALYAYTDGTHGVAVEVVDGEVRATATSGCAG